MTFLDPLSGLLAAGLAVPALLLLYFLKLRRRPVRVSSTLLWERAVHDLQVNVPFRWLRPTWILALQLLALALLLLAAARPALEADLPARARVVIVIDRSASMSALDGTPGPRQARRPGAESASPASPVTRLAEAQRRAARLIDDLARAGARPGAAGRGGDDAALDEAGGTSARGAAASGWGGWGIGALGLGDWGGGSTFMVMTFAAQPTPLTTFQPNPAFAREALEGIAPSDQPGDLAALLRALSALSQAGADADAGPAAQPPTIYLFSDGAFDPPSPRWAADAGPADRAAGADVTAGLDPSPAGLDDRDEAAPLTVAGLDLRFIRVGPRPDPAPAAPTGNLAGAGGGVGIEVVPTSPGAPSAPPTTTDRPPASGLRWNNLGIVACDARRDFDDPATVRVFVRVVSAAEAPLDARVRLSLDGRTISTAPLRVPPGSDESATLTLEHPGAGVITVSIEHPDGRPDLLAADDAAVVVLPAPRPPVVWLVAPPLGRGPTPAAPGTDRFLRSILAVTKPAALVELTPEQVAPAWAAAAALADAPGPAGARRPDLVIFDRVALPSLPEGMNAVPSLSFAAGLPWAGVQVGDVAPGEGRSARVIGWQRQHPLLRHVPLDNLVAAPLRPVTLTPVPGRAVSVESIADAASGPMMLAVDDAGVRRVVVAFDLTGSNFAPSAALPVFATNALDALTPRAEALRGRALRTDEPALLTPAPGARTVAARGPITRVAPAADARPEASGPGAPVSLGVLERVGLYRLEGVDAAAGGAGGVLAVNLLDAGESRLRTRDRLPVVGAAAQARDGDALAPRELWPLLVVTALVLLSIEWFLFAFRMRG